MSPFDLRGPEFLLFYSVMSAVVLWALVAVRRRLEPHDPVKADVSDPYLVANLRGGKNELLRVSTVSLIHRGLLKVNGTSVSVTSENAANGVRNPLERELLLYFRDTHEASSVFSEPRLSLAAQRYDQSLEGLGLLPSDSVRAGRWRILGVVLLVLWGVAFTKIVIAIDRGHYNIGFLILLAIVFGVAASKIARPRLTLRGKTMLEDLRSLFTGLKTRSSSSFTSNDVTLLAAVYGLAALPYTVFPYGKTLYPKAMQTVVDGITSGDASAGCGSSGGDGGGGCGGGGCGGGCGGCGG